MVAFTPKENGLLYVIHCLETMSKDGLLDIKMQRKPFQSRAEKTVHRLAAVSLDLFKLHFGRRIRLRIEPYKNEAEKT